MDYGAVFPDTGRLDRRGPSGDAGAEVVINPNWDMARSDEGSTFHSRFVYAELDPNLNLSTMMIQLTRFLENPFDDAGISLDELIAFTTDHLQRMIANNPGALLNARITATTAMLAVVESCTTDDLTKLGLRKGAKLSKNTYREALPDNIARIHAAVVYKFGPNGPQVLNCFPQGRTVFSQCTDDNLENHLQTLLNGVTAHQAQIGVPVVADVGGLLSTWTAIYAASESSSGAKTTTQEGKKQARLNLQLELFKNLLTIALNFPRQLEKLPLYMQQSLLEDHPPQPEEPTPPPTP